MKRLQPLLGGKPRKPFQNLGGFALDVFFLNFKYNLKNEKRVV